MQTKSRFSIRPLYLQVRDSLVQRIESGAWRPGVTLPNEIDLARELGVSVGTIRKALEEMETEHLISRHQGRGTFVNDHSTAEKALRFNNLRNGDGHRLSDVAVELEAGAGPATEAERERLGMVAGQRVVRFRRVRQYGDRRFMYEEAVLPEARFPDLATRSPVSPNIVVLAQAYGIYLGRAEEKISTARASETVAEALLIAEGEPLLVLDRVVYAIDGRPVEWRIAQVHLGDTHYLASMH